MNNIRRKEIRRIEAELQTLLGDIDSVKDEEQEAFDNMPEGLQASDRGEEMEQNISNLEDVVCNIQEAIDNLTLIE